MGLKRYSKLQILNKKSKQNMGNDSKAVMRKKFIKVNAYMRNKNYYQMNNLISYNKTSLKEK